VPVPLDALMSTVAELWPDGDAEVGRRGNASDRDRSFLLIPNAASPRLLVPTAPSAAAAGAMRRYSSALGVGESATRTGVSLLLRVGGTAAFRDRVTVSSRGDSIEDHLGSVLGQPVVCSLSVGTERANRKPVLQVFDRRGHCIAFVKVGTSPFTERLIEFEHDHLRTLAEHRLPPYLLVPEVLWFGRWRGHVVLVVTDLRPSVLSTVARNEAPAPVKAMEEFAAAFSAEPAPLTEMTLWQELLRIQDLLTDEPGATRFRAALEAIEPYAGDELLPVGAWHGDWTPWNMGWRGKRLALWDWERFQVGAPFGLDAIHYAAYARCRKDGFHPHAVLRGVVDAGHPADIAAPTRSVAAAAYLATLAGRSLEGAEQHTAGAAQRWGDLTLEALRSWTRT
jgi:hypothetical protein